MGTRKRSLTDGQIEKIRRKQEEKGAQSRGGQPANPSLPLAASVLLKLTPSTCLGRAPALVDFLKSSGTRASLMRSEEEMMALIRDFVAADPNIRVAVLMGSRAKISIILCRTISDPI